MPHAFSRKKLLFWKITLSESTLLCFPLFFSSIFPIIFFVLLKKNKQKIWQMRSFSNIGSFFHGVNWILFNNSNLQISFQYHHSKKRSFNIHSYSIFKKRSFMFCMPIRDTSSSVLYKKSIKVPLFAFNTHRYELFNHRLHFLALNWHEKTGFTSLKTKCE